MEREWTKKEREWEISNWGSKTRTRTMKVVNRAISISKNYLKVIFDKKRFHCESIEAECSMHLDFII